MKKYRDSKYYFNSGLRDRFDDYYRCYKGERVKPSYLGLIEVVNREPHTIIETLTANIAGGMPMYKYLPTTEEQNSDTHIINSVTEYWLYQNAMKQKNQIWVRESLLYGTGIIHVSWRNGRPYIEIINIRDFFIDPNATCIFNGTRPARYAGHEYLANKADLEAAVIYDAKTDSFKKKYKNLDKIGNTPNTGGEGGESEMDKEFKDLFNGSTTPDATEDQVHVIVLYDLDSGKIFEIGNKLEIIYEADSYLQRDEETRTEEVFFQGEIISQKKKLSKIDPFLPYAALIDYIDPSLFYGEGEMAIIFDDAELLNDLESMDADFLAYQVTPTFTMDPMFADLIPDFQIIPGNVIPVPRGALNPVTLSNDGGQMSIKKQEIISRMRRATAADEAVQGVSQAKGRTTATEIGTQIQQAQNRFSTKITNMAAGGYADLGRILFWMMCIFLTPDKAIRIVGPQGIEWKNFDPWEWDGDLDPQVELQSEIDRKKIEVGQKDNQIYQILATNPMLNRIELDRWAVKQLDPSMTDDKFNQMIIQNPAPQPDTDKDKVFASLYKNADPIVKAQIEQQLGLQPSPQHEQESELRSAEIAAAELDILNGPQEDQSITR